MAKPKQILLLVETSRVFGRGVIQGISRYGKEHANWHFHYQDRGIREGLSPWLKDWQGDGVITRSSTPALAEVFDQFHCPVVELLGDGNLLSPEVHTDETMTAELAVEHLLKQGFAHLGFYSFANSWWSDARRDSFDQIIRSRELSGHIFPGAYKGDSQPYPTWKAGFEAPLVRWLDRLPKPCGIWTVADSQAIRLLEVCRKLNLRVPAEVGILGTTNDELVCGLLTPPLSSIDLNPQEIGYKAAALLDSKMNSTDSRGSARKEPRTPILVPPSGVVARESSNLVAVTDPVLDQAIKIIEQNALYGLTVEELAEEMLISRSTLERRFREYFKCSPAQEINHVRIERAKAFLRETAWPISAVGQKTGFASPENFVRFFRRLVGETPRQYRTRLYGEDPSA